MKIPASVPNDAIGLSELLREIIKAKEIANEFFARLAERLPEGKTVAEHFSEEELLPIAEEMNFTDEVQALLTWEEGHRQEIEAAMATLEGTLLRYLPLKGRPH